MKYKFHNYAKDYVETVEIRGRHGMCYWLNRDPIIWFDEDGNRFETPKGYVSDGFSIPKWCWKVFFYLLSAIDSRIPGFVHDPAYALQYCTKELADWNIYAGICWLAIGKSRYKRFQIRTAAKIIYAGLKAGGSVAWDRYTEDLKEFGLEKIIEMHTASTYDEAKRIANAA